MLGHCFSGMPAYLSGMDTQMEGKHSQQLSMSSSVGCKSSPNDIKTFLLPVISSFFSFFFLPDKKQDSSFCTVVLSVRLLLTLLPLLKARLQLPIYSV